MFTCSGSGSVEYYVSPKGDDLNNGSISSPWRTISHGVEQLEPGETLIIREGIYKESVSITSSGNEEDYLNIINYQGEKPVIDGSENHGENGLVINSAYLNISGLEIRNWLGNGIWVEDSHHIKIKGCFIHDITYGIGFANGSHDFKLKDCTITQFKLYGFDASPSNGRDCYNGIIENCTAYSCSDPEQNVDGFALGHGNQNGFTLIDCITYEVFDGFDISSEDTALIGCLAFSCFNAGYKIWGDNVTLMNCIAYDSNTNMELDWSGTPKTVRVYHSDFVKSYIFNIWVENQRDRLHLYNSIVACSENIGIAFEDGYQDSYRGDYNIFHNDNEERMATLAYEEEYSIKDFNENSWSQETGQDSNSIIVNDPYSLFEDLDNMNLYPASGSQLIDSADTSTCLMFDFDSHQRPNGESPDIGAYEYYVEREAARNIDYSVSQQGVSQQPEEDNEHFEKIYTNPHILVLALIIISLIIYKKQKIL